jgi:hypothetical protein
MTNFYGVNGHWDYKQPMSLILNNIKTMGMTTYRLAYEGMPKSNAININCLGYIIHLAQSLHFSKSEIKLYLCLDLSLKDKTTGEMWATEQEAYDYGFLVGHTAALALKPYMSNIMAFEIGNELTRKCGIAIPSTVMGTKSKDFDDKKWLILRSVCVGAQTGVKKANPAALCASNAWTYGEYAAAEMLWSGTKPNGAHYAEPLNWDITSVHSYHSWGDPFDMSVDGDGKGKKFDFIKKLKDQFGKPIVISEWNGDAGAQSDMAMQLWVSTMLNKFYGERKELGIQSIMFYAMYDADHPWGCFEGKKSEVKRTFGKTLKDFIASHEDI